MADIDLTINSVTTPTDVSQGTTLTIAVNVTADAASFAEGIAYSLFVYVDGLKAGPLTVPPLTQAGTLQAAPWNTATSTINFSFPVPAAAAPDVYIVAASLLVGPTAAVFQVGPVFANNSVVVHT
jgi:hypothetical protein